MDKNYHKQVITEFITMQGLDEGHIKCNADIDFQFIHIYIYCNQIRGQIRAWMDDYFACIYIDLTIYPCPKLDVKLELIPASERGSCNRNVVVLNRNFTNRQSSNTRHTKYQNLNVSRLIFQLSLFNPLKPGLKSTGDAPTTSERSTILSPTIVYCFILEV